MKIWIGGEVLDKPFLEIHNLITTDQERGLFSMAFAPDYARSGRAYLSFTDRIGNNRVVEYRVDQGDPNRLDPSTRRLILLVQQNSPIHNGGMIGFDASGMLLIAVGDGGPDAPAQDPSTLLGKFVRIDPSKPSGDLPYSIPEDNPFVSAEGVRPEIWAYGLRNPWRWSFDPGTEDLYVGDVGENHSEEINFVSKDLQWGANYGWPRFEGEEAFDARRTIGDDRLVKPILTYGRSGANCAVIGGAVYRGSVPAIRGVYLYGDFCDGVVKGFRITDGIAVEVEIPGIKVPEMVSFGEDSEGEMYVVSLRGGVFRFAGARA